MPFQRKFFKKIFGSKTGEMLWNYTRGIDNREVGSNQEVKSMGAEVNWGVRFNATKEVKKRRKAAEEPIKYVGCGDSDNLNHSITIPTATDDTDVLQKITKQLFASFHDIKEARGIGLQVSRLESADCRNQGCQKNSMRSWLASGSKNVGMLRGDLSHAGQNSSGTGQTVYSGELTRLMNKTEDNDVKLNDTSSKKQKIQESIVVGRKKEKQPICSSPAFANGARTDVEVGESAHAVNELK